MTFLSDLLIGAKPNCKWAWIIVLPFSKDGNELLRRFKIVSRFDRSNRRRLHQSQNTLKRIFRRRRSESGKRHRTSSTISERIERRQKKSCRKKPFLTRSAFARRPRAELRLEGQGNESWKGKNRPRRGKQGKDHFERQKEKVGVRYRMKTSRKRYFRALSTRSHICTNRYFLLDIFLR